MSNNADMGWGSNNRLGKKPRCSTYKSLSHPCVMNTNLVLPACFVTSQSHIFHSTREVIVSTLRCQMAPLFSFFNLYLLAWSLASMACKPHCSCLLCFSPLPLVSIVWIDPRRGCTYLQYTDIEALYYTKHNETMTTEKAQTSKTRPYRSLLVISACCAWWMNYKSLLLPIINTIWSHYLFCLSIFPNIQHVSLAKATLFLIAIARATISR